VKKPLTAATTGRSSPGATPSKASETVSPRQPMTRAVRRPSRSMIQPPATPPAIARMRVNSNTVDHWVKE